MRQPRIECVRATLAWEGANAPHRGGASRIAVLALLLALLASAASAQDARIPVIESLEGPSWLRVSEEGTLSLAFRAPRQNVVAVLEEIVEAPARGRPPATAQRQFPVVSRAYGKASGTLAVQVRFATAGTKRITLALITDDGLQSEPSSIELEVVE